jgi:hypothetical protein
VGPWPACLPLPASSASSADSFLSENATLSYTGTDGITEASAFRLKAVLGALLGRIRSESAGESRLLLVLSNLLEQTIWSQRGAKN